MDSALTERAHRDNDHLGLPVATVTQAGYMSPADKAMLDALAAAAAAPAAATDYVTEEELAEALAGLSATTGGGGGATSGLATVWLSPRAAHLPAAGGATLEQNEEDVNTIHDDLSFDHGVDNEAQWAFGVPEGYTGAAIGVTIYLLYESP